MIMTVKTASGNHATVEYTYDLPMFRDAMTVKNHVQILPTKIDDTGLLSHELTHVDQWYRHPMYTRRYKYFAGFRKKMESEAYAAQLKADNSRKKIKKYAVLLSQKYNLGITPKEAAKEILNAAKGLA